MGSTGGRVGLETRRLQIDATDPEPEVIQQAVEVLRGSGLVAFPTETVYGLGANALDAVAVARIFEAKGRPSNNPLIVHVPDVEAAKACVSEWTPEAEQLAQRFWPGSLTLILPKHACIPAIVTAGGETVALRVPAHPVALALLRAAQFPIAAPSANPSLGLSPTQAEHVWRGLQGRIEMLLDGGQTSGGVESTVLNLASSPPCLLRPGLVTPSEVAGVIGSIEVYAPSQGESLETPLLSPGLLRKHYAPRAPLVLVGDEALDTVQVALDRGQRVGLLAFQAVAHRERLIAVQMPMEPYAYTARLFSELHALDVSAVDCIVVVRPPAGEAWLAVQDRLYRAAAKDV